MATNILDLVNHVQRQGELGRARGKESALAKLASQSYGAPLAQQSQFVQQAIGVDPDAGFALGKNLQSGEQARNERVANMAKVLVGLPEHMKPGYFRQMAPTLRQLGLQVDDNYLPEYGEVAQRIVDAWGGAKNDRNVVVAPGSAIVDETTGKPIYERPYTPQMHVRDQPGLPFDIFDKRTGQSIYDRPQPQVTLGQPMPFTIGPDVPPEVAAQIHAQETAAGGTYAGTTDLPPRLDYHGGGERPPMRPGMTPAQMAADRRAQEAAGRADRADARAQADFERRQRGTPPPGYRFNARGDLELIPGAPTPRGAQPTEGERSAAGYLQRMEAAEQELDALRNAGYTPEGELLDYYTAGEGPARNWMASEQGQHNRQQQEDWVRAKLRKESGAVIAEEEMDREIKTYFPQPGDSAAVIESKARSRKRALEQLRQMAGRAVQQRKATPPANARFPGFRLIED